MFIKELRGSSSVPLDEDLGDTLLQKQRGVLWCEGDSALIGKRFQWGSYGERGVRCS